MIQMQWKDWLEAIGVVAIVASLVFVGLQLRQSQDIALSQGNIDNLTNKLMLSSAINANADVWVRGNAGGELEESEAAIYWNLVRDMNDSAFFNVQRLERMGLADPANVAIADFAAYLYENPGALRTWNAREAMLNRNRDLLAPDSHATFSWRSRIQSHLDRLAATAP